jgi:RNA polymerase subunit RPABC4/transcription elongation factor Spt4
MTSFAQCKKCKTIYKFPVIDDKIPPCPNCGGKGITDDGGFLVNGLNPDDMYSTRKNRK